MVNSVNTNAGSLVALQSLNRTNDELGRVQKRVTTGFRVNDAVDDGAAFAVAQSIRGEQGALGAVNQQLSIAKGAVGVFSTAATNVSNTLNKAKETLIKLADQGLSTDQRSKYNADFQALAAEAKNYISNAKFNNRNLLNASFADIKTIANTDGTQYRIGSDNSYSIATAVSAAFTVPADASAAALALAGTFLAAQTRVGTVLNGLGSDTRRLDAQIGFNKAVNDALTTSLGAIVDADLAKESANLQSLQIKQQLGAQTLGIANQAPQILSSLFR
jgi:flagellin